MALCSKHLLLLVIAGALALAMPLPSAKQPPPIIPRASDPVTLEIYDMQGLTAEVWHTDCPEVDPHNLSFANRFSFEIDSVLARWRNGRMDDGPPMTPEQFLNALDARIPRQYWEHPGNEWHIEYNNGLLIVRHTAEAHGAVRSLIRRLRDEHGVVE